MEKIGEVTKSVLEVHQALKARLGNEDVDAQYAIKMNEENLIYLKESTVLYLKIAQGLKAAAL